MAPLVSRLEAVARVGRRLLCFGLVVACSKPLPGEEVAGFPRIYAMAGGTDGIYVAAGSVVQHVALDGGGVTTTQQFAGRAPVAVTAAGDALWYAPDGTQITAQDGGVVSWDACCVQRAGLVRDGAQLFWLGLSDAGATGAVKTLADDGGTLTLAEVPVDARGLAASDDALWWILDGGSLVRLPRDGGDAAPVASVRYTAVVLSAPDGPLIAGQGDGDAGVLYGADGGGFALQHGFNSGSFAADSSGVAYIAYDLSWQIVDCGDGTECSAQVPVASHVWQRGIGGAEREIGRGDDFFNFLVLAGPYAYFTAQQVLYRVPR